MSKRTRSRWGWGFEDAAIGADEAAAAAAGIEPLFGFAAQEAAMGFRERGHALLCALLDFGLAAPPQLDNQVKITPNWLPFPITERGVIEAQSIFRLVCHFLLRS